MPDLIVSNFFTAGGLIPDANGVYTQSAFTNAGKGMWYKFLDAEAFDPISNAIITGHIVYFTGTQWRLRTLEEITTDEPDLTDYVVTTYYRASNSDSVTYPWEVTDWATSSGPEPVPTFEEVVEETATTTTTLTVNQASGSSETYEIIRENVKGVRTLTVDGVEVTIDRTKPTEASTLLIDGSPVTIDRTDVQTFPYNVTQAPSIVQLLADVSREALKDRVNVVSSDTIVDVFSSSDNSNGGSYTRNTQNWFYDRRSDLTGISNWNSASGTQRQGTAITKRHLVGASHFTYPVGTNVRFVTADNEVVERTVVASSVVTPANITTDGFVYLLDADLPDTIRTYKVVPTNEILEIHPEFDTTNRANLNFNTLWCDKDNKLQLADVISSNVDIGFDWNEALTAGTNLPVLSGWKSFPVLGDSGSAYMLATENDLALWGTAHTNLSLFDYGLFFDELKETVDSLSAGAGLDPKKYQPELFEIYPAVKDRII